MKIKRSELKKIVMEAIKDVLTEGGFGSGMKLTPAQLRRRERQRDEADKNNRRKVNALGGPDMVALSRGIAEDTDEEVNCSDGNPYHDDEGEFTDDKGTGSWSIRKRASGCKRGQYQKKHGGKSEEECGRGAPVKCKDGAIKEVNDQEKTDWMYEYHKLKKKHALLIKKFELLKKKKTPKRKGASMEACLNWVDSVQRSSKGTLKDKPKR